MTGSRTWRFTSAAWAILLLGDPSVSQAAEIEAAESGPPLRSLGFPRAPAKYLLLDSRIVAKTENARLRVGRVTKHAANPLFGEDKPWEPRFDNLYANIVHDREDGLYKCWYSPFIVDAAASATPRELRGTTRYRPRHREMGICYAFSRDGLRWEKPELGLVKFDGKTANNLVLRGPHGAGIFDDTRDRDASRRFKMLYKSGRMSVRFSADGLRWTEEVPCPQIAARGDTHNNAFWCPELGRFVGITRLWDGQRIVGRTESTDFLNWTKAVEILRGDKENQTYAMPVLRYAGIYLGLVMVFRPRPDRVHCELAWSPDTVTWHRVDPGTPLIPNSEKKGDYDWGCVYAAAYPILANDEIRLYYGASNGPHTGFRDGFLALATLRPDGFAGYEPVEAGHPAAVMTRPVAASGEKLRITADAASGSVQVTVLDDRAEKVLAVSKPISGNVTGAPVSFGGAAEFSKLRGRRLRLKFELSKSVLYSFAFVE